MSPDTTLSRALHVSTDPPDITRRLASAGHLGLFMGRHALEYHWAMVFEDIARRS